MPGCSVDGCLLTIHARGLCEPHWSDLARGRGVFAPELARGKPSGGQQSPLKDRVYPGAGSPHRYELEDVVGDVSDIPEEQVERLDPFDVCRVVGCGRERVGGGLWCRGHDRAVEQRSRSLPADIIAAAPPHGAMTALAPGVALPDVVVGDLPTYGLRPVEIGGRDG
jgi:hypothetical protein